MLIDLESMLQHPPSSEFVIGQHRATDVVMAVWRQRAKLYGEILMMVDATYEGQVSGGGVGRWKGPLATLGGLLGFLSNGHSHCCSSGFEL